MLSLYTQRLELVPVTLPMVEAALADQPHEICRLLGASLASMWPGRELIERAFCASIDAIRANPEARLWGDRIALSRGPERTVIGSVIFHGHPIDGLVEVGYGVDVAFQRSGYATEATLACVNWALEQPGVTLVRATTPPWHTASMRVLIKCGFADVGPIEHETLGEVLAFERTKESIVPASTL